jgi:hypothetical protein
MVKIRSPWAFLNSFNLPEPFTFGIFVKTFFQSNFGRTSSTFAQKNVPFFRKKITRKSGIRFGILKYFFYNLE